MSSESVKKITAEIDSSKFNGLLISLIRSSLETDDPNLKNTNSEVFCPRLNIGNYQFVELFGIICEL